MKILICSLTSLFSLLLIAYPVEAQQSTPYYNNYNPGTNIQPAIHTANQAYAPSAMPQQNEVVHAALVQPGENSATQPQFQLDTPRRRSVITPDSDIPVNVYNTPIPYTIQPKISSHLSFDSRFLNDDMEFDVTAYNISRDSSNSTSVEKTKLAQKETVLIEVKIISIDTSDDRTLGVEISGGDRSKASSANKLFAFNRFGLNSITPGGVLGIDPGKSVGFNGVMVNPDTADVIVRALSQNSHVKVESTPRVLVIDENVGVIMSTLGIAYETKTAMPNVGVADSFGGYKDAGTVITAKPTILSNNVKGEDVKDDERRVYLKFLIQHGNFVTGTKAVSSSNPQDTKLPPPIHGDSIKSEVIIPNKHTLIVGGLNRFDTQKEQQGIPGLMHIPLIKHIASYQKDTQSRTTLFFFITATIVDPENESKFDKLKYMNTQIHGLNLVPKD